MKFKFILGMLLMLIFPVSTTANDNIDQTNVHSSRQYKSSRDATVKIISPQGHGTGTYVKIAGVYGIITAGHVVEAGADEADSLFIIESGSQQTIAQLVWRDPNSDFAFLVTGELTGKKAKKISTAENVEVGDELIYSGFPSTHDMLTFTCRIINKDMNGYIALQGHAWFGASGSGFINEKGKVIAVLSAVTVENFFGHPQVIDTIVIATPITDHHVEQIEANILERKQ